MFHYYQSKTGTLSPKCNIQLEKCYLVLYIYIALFSVSRENPKSLSAFEILEPAHLAPTTMTESKSLRSLRFPPIFIFNESTVWSSSPVLAQQNIYNIALLPHDFIIFWLGKLIGILTLLYSGRAATLVMIYELCTRIFYPWLDLCPQEIKNGS